MRRTPEARIRKIALSLLALAALPVAAQDPDTAWIDEDRVQNGEIAFDFGDDRRFHGLVRAAVMIAAPPERIWAVLRDCEAAPEYLDNVESCERVATIGDGQAEVFRQRAKLRWFLPSFEHEFRLDYEPYRRITVSRVSGPLDRLDAVWWLESRAPDRTLVIYRLNLDAGPLLPNFLLGTPLRRDVLTALAAVRERAEHPG